ncbi:hypothetical protein J6590_083890 [Homalodisca vitripennis]|nr:hypothetical protein J6590_083890 [Homalodisca vitripennis]
MSDVSVTRAGNTSPPTVPSSLYLPRVIVTSPEGLVRYTATLCIYLIIKLSTVTPAARTSDPIAKTTKCKERLSNSWKKIGAF